MAFGLHGWHHVGVCVCTMSAEKGGQSEEEVGMGGRGGVRHQERERAGAGGGSGPRGKRRFTTAQHRKRTNLPQGVHRVCISK